MSGAVIASLASGGSTLKAELNRQLLSGTGSTPGSIQTTQSVTCTAVGGTPPYTYAWTDVGSTSIFPTAPVLPTSRFVVYFSSANSAATTYVCTVTDSTMATAVSLPVSITLTGFAGSGEF